MAHVPATLLLGILASALAVSCQHTDYGSPCPQLLDGNSASVATDDPSLTNTQSVVGENPGYPCEQLICVAADGVSGYCSGKCLDDAGCPGGFTCAQVQGVGGFSRSSFCIWKTCNTASDCGSGSNFCCNSVSGGNPDPNVRLCSYKTKGKCS